MNSMTGYGISHWKTKDCYIEVIVQSYNSKHFESRVGAPPFYSSMEGEFRKKLEKKFQRGAINLLITRSPSWPLKKTTVKWNKEQALKWRALYRQMAVHLKMENKLDLHDLVQQPGVLEIQSQSSLVSAKEKNKLKTLLRKSIDLCSKERAREGRALKKDFQKNTKQLLLSLQKIKLCSDKQKKQALKNIKKKINDVIDEKTLLRLKGSDEALSSGEGGEWEGGRSGSSQLVRFKTMEELTGALINRMDTSEEISRMEEHIRAFRALISSSGSIGKKMSFYLQEMVREINTIGSKSQNFQLTQAVVHSKSLIEKMREQVQNVE